MRLIFWPRYGQRPISACVVRFLAVTVLAVMPALKGYGSRTTSGDAYARIDRSLGTVEIGTASVEEKIQLLHGRYLLKSLVNKVSHREYISDGSLSEEFKVRINGQTITGANGRWSWIGAEAKITPQQEIEVTVHLQNTQLQVDKYYRIYPKTSIIRQWVIFKNRSDGPLTIANPYMLDQRLSAKSATTQTLSYMTGGGSFTGSQVLKQVPLPATYIRKFDTTDPAEVQDVDGIRLDHSMAYGSGRYMPWFCVSSPDGGVFLGFDYYGRWVAEIGNVDGAPGYLGVRLAGYEKTIQPGEFVETPKAFIGVYAGDLDAMGNQLKAWQYRFLWNFTNDNYFAKIRYAAEMRWQPGKGSAWGGGTEDNWDYRLAAMFHTADVIRYVGADILWQDAGWHDYLGDNNGPDFAAVNSYLAKSGARLAVWWPLWYAEKQSKVVQEHPNWGAGGVFKEPFDASRPEIIHWMSKQLDEKVAKWGNFQWREDGSAVAPVGGKETPMLVQFQNIMEMQRQFRIRHPQSSIDLCAGGGNLMSFEGLRLADVSQLTDGGSLTFGNYYSSYLFPPDKIDDWTRTQNSTWENMATTLTMAPAWMGDRGLYGHEPGILLNDGKENLRKTFEIYHYLVREGVAGRWAQIYHPKVEGDSPIYYLERLSADGQRGVVVLKHFLPGDVRIYPKGLQSKRTYDVQFRISQSKSKRSGDELASHGIELVNPQPGELIYLGLPNHPGSGTDSIAPTAPANVTMGLGTNMGVTGMELNWEPSSDNNWISYYQIYRDGKSIDRVSTGTFYFDHSAAPDVLFDSNYQVQAVDGDGNASAKVDAVDTGNGAEIYTALGGYLSGKDYSYQGANGWSYEEWDGDKHVPLTWNGSLGQMGQYEGAPGAYQVLIGGSWMRPGQDADAVRTFTAPATGQVAIIGSVHKDIYHTSGDGVRVKILKGDQQIWPDNGWVTIAAADIMGTKISLTAQVQAGDKLYFVINRNENSVDDDTVWNPQIRYAVRPQKKRSESQIHLDNVNSAIRYLGKGWQYKGSPPRPLGQGIGLDSGYLQDRFKGTLSVSGTPGDKVALSFHGTGIQLIGDTGSDRGIAQIRLDGKDVATIDTFVPENYPFSGGHTSKIREPNNVAINPPITLWAASKLTPGDHTLEVIVTGHRNSESTGTFIGIDELVVEGGTSRQTF